MSQYDFGTINPNTVDGDELAQDLGNWRDALHSSQKGSTRPTYAVAGMIWIDDSATPWKRYLYDGAKDILTGFLDPTSHLFIPAATMPEVIKTANYTVTTADAGTAIVMNKSSAATVALPAVGDANAERYFVRNIAADDVTINPNASEQIEDAGTITLKQGAAAIIWPNAGGTAWRALIFGGTGSYATAAQGALADSAVQPGDLANVATSGSYDDLTDKPTTGGIVYQEFTASGTWTKPTGLDDNAIVEIDGWGAGGGGNTSGSNATGGGGGAYAQKIRLRAGDLPATVTVTVGAGGAVGANGQPGGNSTFGSYLTAYGGGGGNNASGGGGGGGSKGAGTYKVGGDGYFATYDGGGKGASSAANAQDSYFGGGGGGYGGSTHGSGADSVFGGGGGGYATGGTSKFGGQGGVRQTSTPPTAPGGGGTSVSPGADGMIRVWVIK